MSVYRLCAEGSPAVESICGDVLKAGGRVLGIAPNMDRRSPGGFDMNYENAPAYFVFAECPAPLDPQVAVWLS
jgi:hypothetical protein